MQSMYYIGLDVHKRTISYCVKDGSGKIHAEGTIPATRFDLAAIRLGSPLHGWRRDVYWLAIASLLLQPARSCV